VYTFEGGMTAVIWTDVVQMCLYVTGAVVSFFVILSHIPGGWAHVAAVAGSAGKLKLFDFGFAPSMAFLSRPYTFWAGLAGGCFLTMASHGTDQLMVQRLLSARSQRQSRAALVTSWGVIFVQFSLFLLIGVLLFVYYRDSGLPAPRQMDRIYPEFLWRNLAPGVAGLTIAAILAAAMANLSAALNALAATTVVDFLHGRAREGKPLPEEVGKDRLAGESACPTKTELVARQSGTDASVCQHLDFSDSFTPSDSRGSDVLPGGGKPLPQAVGKDRLGGESACPTKTELVASGSDKAETRALWQARVATVGWAAVLLAIGILARRWGSVLEAGLTIASIPSGALLGVFLLGVLLRRPRGSAAVAGVAAGLAAILYVRFRTPVAFTWYVLIGTCVTFGVGCLASLFQGADKKKELS